MVTYSTHGYPISYTLSPSSSSYFPPMLSHLLGIACGGWWECLQGPQFPLKPMGADKRRKEDSIWNPVAVTATHTWSELGLNMFAGEV